MRTLQEMTLQEKLGQRLAAGFQGLEPPEEFLRLIKEYKVGNIILFRRNIQDGPQLKKLCATLRKVVDADIKKLVLDDDVTKKAGIIPFILSDRIWRDEKHLSLRAFTESQKLRAYESQGHKCPLCVANGIYTEYAFEDMEGDHIIPWSKGGHTTDNNLQMLCKKCNAAKSDK